jgi:hypothetical protein
MSKTILIYNGAIKANHVGAFTRGGVIFDIVSPGYDSQGRRRTSWIQYVHEGVPVFETKMDCSLKESLELFDSLWKESIGDNASLLVKAIAAAKVERLSRFKDGKTGIEGAPALKVDGRPEGKKYPA